MVRITMFLWVGILLAAGCGNPEPVQPETTYQRGDTLQLSGTLVDSRCFGENEDNIGNDHDRPEGHITACGTACAKLGLPVAVVEGGVKSGKTWVLLTVPQVLADYISSTVRVAGTVRDEGILIPSRIELKTSDGWTIIL